MNGARAGGAGAGDGKRKGLPVIGLMARPDHYALIVRVRCASHETYERYTTAVMENALAQLSPQT